MWSQRFPLKRWEFYQDLMYRENGYCSFVFMPCFAYPWKYESSALLLIPLKSLYYIVKASYLTFIFTDKF